MVQLFCNNCRVETFFDLQLNIKDKKNGKEFFFYVYYLLIHWTLQLLSHLKTMLPWRLLMETISTTQDNMAFRCVKSYAGTLVIHIKSITITYKCAF